MYIVYLHLLLHLLSSFTVLYNDKNLFEISQINRVKKKKLASLEIPCAYKCLLLQ